MSLNQGNPLIVGDSTMRYVDILHIHAFILGKYASYSLREKVSG